ncbi:MAG: trehalose-6-phosphate synthase [Cellulomonadaceae bacterium]|nr:trehalose-6-phosphate synthase [Cellulomonadaceae bacterium]
MEEPAEEPTRYNFVVVANRLPVDFTVKADGTMDWKRAPGGLVTALQPVMQDADGAWVGWSGAADLEQEPFDAAGMRLIPVTLSAHEIAEYYEGFSNDTLWPLYHDVVAVPAYHREWWTAYRKINQRFAEAAAAVVEQGGTVWVQDYQLQLVPKMVRELRPDVRIGFFDHIPFPPVELFSQLPWRRHIVEGLLGADLLGFQRQGDAANFLRAVRKLTKNTTRGSLISMKNSDGTPARRTVRAESFPISIDSARFNAMAKSRKVQARAKEIRKELGNPTVIMLGVDRLDYTKGIIHRTKAFGELCREHRIDVSRTCLVQIASPSRENVAAYQELRDEVELLCGRINGEFGEFGHQPIHYRHHGYPAEEMAALYLAADVMLVTSLRDGMNLVAKEYVAARSDERGVLVLSEFTGAADELGWGPLLVNPHDIDGLKDSMVSAARMSEREQRRRMRRLRSKVGTDDVAKWSATFLDALDARPAPRRRAIPAEAGEGAGREPVSKEGAAKDAAAKDGTTKDGVAESSKDAVKEVAKDVTKDAAPPANTASKDAGKNKYTGTGKDAGSGKGSGKDKDSDRSSQKATP